MAKNAELKKLKKLSGMSEHDILVQIRDWFERGQQLANNIRLEFEQEDKIFNNQKKNKEKIWDNTYFSVHSSLMAREYVDRPTSQFQATTPAQFNQVKNLNAALDSDFNSREYETLRYQLLSDKYRRWVGIALRRWWDGFKKMPRITSIDPRLAIFDPDGDYITGEYDFFWYEQNEYTDNLAHMGYFNLENLNTSKGDTNWPQRVQETDQENAGLIQSFGKNNNNPSIRIYNHFGTFNWQRAFVVTWNNNTELIFVKVLDNVDNVHSFEDYLAFRYWRPDRNNPYGQRIAKLGVADLQEVRAQIANLRLDKSKAELYPMYLYNSRLIKNKDDLNFGFNKLVAANPLEWESLNNAVTPIQRDVRADNSYILDDSIEDQVESITGINRLAMWSSPERREAATTNKIIQWNTDINLAFNAKIDAQWEEALLRVWLAGYLDKLEDWDAKIIYIETGFGQLPRELKKKDFISDLAVKIKIETKVEIDERNQTDRIAYAQMIWFLQWLPWRSESAQMNTYRNFWRSWGMTEAQINMELPPTAQEIIAQENVSLLLQWETVQVQQDYDPDTHLLAIQAAWNSDNVELYKYELLKLKKIKPQQVQQEAPTAVSNNLAAQAWASASNEAQGLLSQL